jgi:ribosomal protein L24E
MTEKKCENCGKVFAVINSRSKIARFCSRKCKYEIFSSERSIPTFDRWASKIVRTESGCWEWAGSVDGGGYGHLKVGRRGKTKKTIKTHRFAFEEFRYPVPMGLELDHLCRNRRCSNPFHLEPVTRRENVLRGTGMGARHAAKTHCDGGHELTPENSYSPPGRPHWRQCRICRRKYARNHWERTKLAQAS